MGPNDAAVQGEERKKAFAGHFANINRLADEGKLAVAGPFGKNDKSYRGLSIFNEATVEEAEKLVVLDPAVAAGILVPELALVRVGRAHGRDRDPPQDRETEGVAARTGRSILHSRLDAGRG